MNEKASSLLILRGSETGIMKKSVAKERINCRFAKIESGEMSSAHTLASVSATIMLYAHMAVTCRPNTQVSNRRKKRRRERRASRTADGKEEEAAQHHDPPIAAERVPHSQLIGRLLRQLRVPNDKQKRPI